MFGWFSKKKKEPKAAEILRIDDNHFVDTINLMVTKETPASCAMIIVAYRNLSPLLDVSKALPGLPSNIDEFLYMLAEKIETETEEIGLRRTMWFFLSGLIKRATDKASVTPHLQDKIVTIWIHLINGSKPIAHLLKHNVIWSDSEKLYFLDIQDEKSGMEYTLNAVAPAWIRKHSLIINFAKEQGLRVSSYFKS
jgi:hypothetical protein